MAKARSLVGLDVHATKIVAAVLDAETGQLQTFAMSGENTKAAAFCAGLPRPVRVAYEAGPTGYGLARELAKRGVECVVAAPSKIPRASGDRVKTDRRDAEHLVRLLLAGKLHAVRVPGDEEEALARPGPRPGRGADGPDALPTSALEAAAAARDPVRRRGGVDAAPPRLAGDGHAAVASGAGDAARRPRRDRRARAPP